MTYRARVQRMDCGLRGCAMCAVMIACQISHHWFCLPQDDGFEHPMDRWSARVIGNLSTECGGTLYFPFGGAPYHPFYSWALSTGRVYASPLRFLVDHESGLYVSFRGAIGFTHEIADPRPVLSTPCAGCAAPCLTSCPADAVDENDYNVPKCKSYLINATGSCETFGCAARRACPHTAKTQRPTAHAQFHMRAFKLIFEIRPL